MWISRTDDLRLCIRVYRDTMKQNRTMYYYATSVNRRNIRVQCKTCQVPWVVISENILIYFVGLSHSGHSYFVGLSHSGHSYFVGLSHSGHSYLVNMK